jgi:Putative beta-barrel porin-2, OmpL-like. bbp2
MHPRSFVSVAALCAGALALPHAVEAQVAVDQQAQATPAPVAPAPAAPAAPTSNAMTTPAMGGTITANPNPYSVDLGPWLGKTYVGGVLSGMGFVQSNHVPVSVGVSPPSLPNGFSGNTTANADLTNGMVEVQKTDGQFQYFLMAGAYSFPIVGVPYINAKHANSAFFGPLPLAFAKWVPTDSFSLEAGKLPTLIGEEGTFTFQNLNVERGLLWNQENLINRGVQGNYTWGPLGFALSWNDGFYSDHFTYLTGSVTWTVDSADTLILAGGGNTSTDHTINLTTNNPLFVNTFNAATPEPQASEQQYDLSWTWTGGPWVINPYIQYTHTPSVTILNGAPPVAFNSGATYGAALLVGYTFDPATSVMGMSLGGWSLPARVEYISSTGHASGIAGTAGFLAGPNLLGYGPGSKAWELTITPTFQYKIFFARAEASFIKASSITAGAGFGTSGTSDTQVRGILEAGLVF